MVTFHLGTHNDNPAGKALYTRSQDKGKTWSKPEVLYDIPGQDDRETMIVQTSDGTIWAGGWSVRFKGPGGDLEYTTVLSKSQDAGHTWSAPIETGGDGFLRWLPGLQMSNGELLFLGAAEDPESRRSIPPSGWISAWRATFVLRQDDKGIHWENYPQKVLGYLDEFSVVETNIPGTLVALLRHQYTGEYYYQSTSTDYGRTWSKPWPTVLWYGVVPSRALLRKMRDGTLIAFFAERANNRIVAVPSFDNGKTWDVSHKLIVLDNPESMTGDSGYPDGAPIEENSWLAVYYVRADVQGTFLDTRYFKDVYGGLRLAQTSPPVAESTIAHWSFDDGGKAPDWIAYDSVRNNYGKVYGWKPQATQPVRAPGKVGQALVFDGTNDYVLVPDSDTLRLPRFYALETWINTTDSNRSQTIMDKGPAYYLGLRGGRLFFKTGNVKVLGNSEVNSNVWHHVGVVVKPSLDGYVRATLFLDGQADGAKRLEDSDSIPKDYFSAQAQNDARIVSGTSYQIWEPGKWDQAAEALVLGISRDFKFNPFLGMMDEVTLHGLLGKEYDFSLEAKTGAEFFTGLNRSYYSQGSVVSSVITRPSGSRWAVFNVAATTPQGTSIAFDILDEKGQVVKSQVVNGQSIADVNEQSIRIKATLSTTIEGQSPAIYSWSASWEPR